MLSEGTGGFQQGGTVASNCSRDLRLPPLSIAWATGEEERGGEGRRGEERGGEGRGGEGGGGGAGRRKVE